MHCSSLGVREGTRKSEEMTRGRITWDKLKFVVETCHKNTGMERRKRCHVDTRQCDTANDVSGKFAHQKGIR